MMHYADGNDLQEALKFFDTWVAERRKEIQDGRCGGICVSQGREVQPIHEAGTNNVELIRVGPTTMTIEFGNVGVEEINRYKKSKRARREITAEMRERIASRGDEFDPNTRRPLTYEELANLEEAERLRQEELAKPKPKYQNPALENLHKNPYIEEMGANILEIKPSGSLIISFDGDLSGYEKHLSHGKTYRFFKHQDTNEYSYQTWSLDADDHDCASADRDYGADVLLVWDDGVWVWDLDS